MLEASLSPAAGGDFGAAVAEHQALLRSRFEREARELEREGWDWRRLVGRRRPATEAAETTAEPAGDRELTGAPH